MPRRATKDFKSDICRGSSTRAKTPICVRFVSRAVLRRFLGRRRSSAGVSSITDGNDLLGRVVARLPRPASARAFVGGRAAERRSPTASAAAARATGSFQPSLSFFSATSAFKASIA